MLPATFHQTRTQINRCMKKLFLLANHYFHPEITGVGHVHAEKIEIFRFFEHVKKVFNENWGVGRGRLCLLSSLV